jgi:glycosyltransferase involved in cell wall biosynthesis
VLGAANPILASVSVRPRRTTPPLAGTYRPPSPSGRADAMQGSGDVELSVVMPCLNEAETLAQCVRTARQALEAHGIAGEIIVADNGSSDGSQEIAKANGARVVSVAERGYGSALMGGIAAARGRYVIMGDADASYDFAEIPQFLAKLRQGYELVQGCRLPAGGGRVEPGAMPVLHRWLGNPVFSRLARFWFRAPINDIHCGLRAFSKALYQRLDQRCTGMEFASEMIIKSALHGARIAEIPIVLRPDGRKKGRSHLRTWRDGWRHLRFFFLFSPRWLFLLPGAALILAGIAAYALGFPRVEIRGVGFDVHTLLFGSVAMICGYQAIIFAVLTKVFAINEGLLPADRRMATLLRNVTLETGLLSGAAALVAGLALLGIAVNEWRAAGYGALDYGSTMRRVIPGMTLTVLGFQTVLSSFYLSILGLRRRK